MVLGLAIWIVVHEMPEVLPSCDNPKHAHPTSPTLLGLYQPQENHECSGGGRHSGDSERTAGFQEKRV